MREGKKRSKGEQRNDDKASFLALWHSIEG